MNYRGSSIDPVAPKANNWYLYIFDDVYLVVKNIFVYFWWCKFSSIYIGLRLIGLYNCHWTYYYTFHTVFGAHFGAYQMKYDFIIP